MTSTKKISFVTLFFLTALFFNGLAQTKTTFKANKKLLVTLDSVLSKSCQQYQILINSTPDTLFPQTYENGKLDFGISSNWVSGFYSGTLLYLYEYNKNKSLYNEALKKMKVLEKEQYNKGTHDLGFMMFCSFGNARRIANTNVYDQILLNSAKSLATRFHPEVGAIRSWDHHPEKWKYPVIIDNMMNLELLTWAGRYSRDSSFYRMAISHADKTMTNHFREDYSSWHVIDYDPQTGNVRNKLTSQGYSDESAWARGQAWGLYGYTVMYRETKDKKYLAQAKNIADFILKHPNLPKDKVPYWDFNVPDLKNTPRDASAAAVICSALLELSGVSGQTKGNEYFKAAEDILRSLSSDQYLAKIGENGGFILKHSVGNYPINRQIDVPLNYADYYYVEAMMRYKKIN